MENNIIKPHPLAAMFFDKSWLLETFLPSYNEIGPVVSDKKIF